MSDPRYAVYQNRTDLKIDEETCVEEPCQQHDWGPWEAWGCPAPHLLWCRECFATAELPTGELSPTCTRCGSHACSPACDQWWRQHGNEWYGRDQL